MTDEQARMLWAIVTAEGETPKVFRDAGVASRKEAADLLRGAILSSKKASESWTGLTATPWARGLMAWAEDQR
jgi:hypothetical protein